MAVIRTNALTKRYRGVVALDDVDWQVPEGAVYGLMGPNGAGKTTLLNIVAGTIEPTSGSAMIRQANVRDFTTSDRQWLGFIAESHRLPEWMTLAQVEGYLAPLYACWDHSLASELRARFDLDARRKVRTLSRGEHMKAALLCSLAPRPQVLLMDEPFTGMDVLVKDDIVRGLLETAGSEGWTLVISSHDVSEFELLADHIGFLNKGRLVLSDALERVRERYLRVEAVLPPGAEPVRDVPADWLAVERSGALIRFIYGGSPGAERQEALRACLPASATIDVRPATLKELFVVLARRQDTRPGARAIAEVSR